MSLSIRNNCVTISVGCHVTSQYCHECHECHEMTPTVSLLIITRHHVTGRPANLSKHHYHHNHYQMIILPMLLCCTNLGDNENYICVPKVSMNGKIMNAQ